MKSCLPDTIGLIHIWTHSNCGSIHKPSRVPVVKGERGHRILSLTRKLSATDIHCQKRKSVSLGILTNYRAGPKPRSSWLTQNKHNGNFVHFYFTLFMAFFFLVLLDFCLFGCLFLWFWGVSVSCFFFLFLVWFLKEKEKEYKGGWVMEVRWL